MADEFKIIETQEALDAIIKDRIERAKKSAADETAKKYATEGDYVAGANIAGFVKVESAMVAQGLV